MKIAIVLGPFQPLPPEGFGAVEKVWVELACAFAAAGHVVTVIGRAAGGGRADRRAMPVRVVEVGGYDATGRIAVDLAKDLAYAVRVVTAIPPSDIVVTNSFWLPVVLSPLKRRKGRIVVHVARFPKGQMWLYRGADAIQTISGAVADAIRAQCGALSARIAVIGYPIDTLLYRPRDGTTADAAPVVLYVGRIHPEKGLHVLVDAFRRIHARMPASRLRLIGPVGERQGGGGEAYLRLLETAASGLPVEFAGAIADPGTLADEYRRATCFCYPSLADKGEAFGRSVLEAMATGLPCVVSDLACFSDFLAHGRDGLVFDHRGSDAVQLLADAIGALLRDRTLAGRIAANARAAAERYASDRIAGEYLALFATVLGAEGGRNA